MEFNFENQTILVTGGSRGIGQAIVEHFAKCGGTVIFTYASSSQKADDLVSSLCLEGLKVSAFKVDVTQADEMQKFIENVIQEHGKIDVLVNNAGITRDKLLLMMDRDDWSQVIDTNLTGLYNTVKPAVRSMLKKRKGSIINLSSIAASKPGKGHCNYAATKGAVESFTKALAAEIGQRNIRVNCIAPGMIETDMSKEVRELAGDQILEMITLKRYGKAQEIAHAVLFLASDYSSYITGETLHVDGGFRG